MKLSTLFLPATLLLFVADGATMTPSIKVARISFESGSETEYSFYEELFIKNSIVGAYQDIHNSKDPALVGMFLDPRGVDKVTFTAFTHTWISAIKFEVCDSCTDAAAVEAQADHLNWERALCNRLQQSALETLHSSQHCSIEFMAHHDLPVEDLTFLPPRPTGLDDDANFVASAVHLQFSFVLHEGRSLSTAEGNYAENAIVAAYNSVHNTYHTSITGVEVESQTVDPAGPTASIFAFLATFDVLSCKECRTKACVMCKSLSFGNPDREDFLQSTEDATHSDWEAAFCSSLRQSPFEIFSHAQDCTIESISLANAFPLPTPLPPVTSTVDTMDEMEETVRGATTEFGINVRRQLTSAEQAFLSNAMVTAYNEIQPPSVSVALSDEIEFGTYQAPGTRKLLTVQFHIHSYFRSARCNFCFGDNNDYRGYTRRCRQCARQLGETREEFVMRVERETHDTWEAIVCNKLRKGPYDVFSQASDCKITLDDSENHIDG